MWKERYLFYLGVAFIAGNLSCPSANITLCAISAAISLLLFILTLLRRTAGIPIIPVALFFTLGMTGALIHEEGRLRPEDSVLLPLTTAGSVRIRGTIESSGLTKKGRPFVEISMGRERTRVYLRDKPPGGVSPSDSSAIFTEATFRPGDTLTCIVRVSAVENFSEGFDYRSYMASKGIFATCFQTRLKGGGGSRAEVLVCEAPSFRHRLWRMRRDFGGYIESRLSAANGRRGLSQENMGLVRALSYGDKGGISQDTQAAFRESGTIHLFAISGMHVGIIYAALAFLLSVLGSAPWAKSVRSVVILGVLWFYAAFAGLATSISRAVLMATVYEAGKLLGRGHNGLNALAFSAMIITSINPDSPSEVGFQLSFGAILGILLFFPSLRAIAVKEEIPVEERILEGGVGVYPLKDGGAWPKALVRVWELMMVSLSCQVFTAPLIWIYFKTYSHFSLFANLVCGSLMSVVMPMIPVSLAFSGIPFLGRCSIWILDAALTVMCRVSNVISLF